MIKIKEINSKGSYIEFCTHELTFLGESGQPYRGMLFIQYITDNKVIELISLKKYIESLRSRTLVLEEVSSVIHSDINNLLKNDTLSVSIKTTPRGGISSTIRHGADYKTPDIKPIVFGN